MPIVIGKNVNFLLIKFTPKAGQIYPQGVNLPPVKNPWCRVISESQIYSILCELLALCFENSKSSRGVILETGARTSFSHLVWTCSCFQCMIKRKMSFHINE